MPAFCLVVGCGSRGERDQVNFYRVPSIYSKGRKICHLSKQRSEKWIQALRRADLTPNKIKNGRICSKHFHLGTPAELQDVNNPDWVPSKNMGYTTQSKDIERHDRYKKRLERAQEVIVDSVEDESFTSVEPTYEELKLELQRAHKEIETLKKELKKYRLEEDYLKENDEQITYYTGLPGYNHFKTILSELVPFLKKRETLPKFQQLLLTLMKLRLNFDFTYLGMKFNCHRTTASRIFENTIHILYCRFKSFIYWPLRHELQINIPTNFRKIFGTRLTAIIDCFEIFTQKPGNVEAAAKTWSNYKHHSTIKFLIGISPQGFIMFISKAYGGRASDKFITEDSGFLNNLTPGDLIIADRGFSIDSSVQLYCAEVRYPTFLKGKNQLGPEDVESTRKLASIRIHVERVIGLLKGKFKILHYTFPLTQLKKNKDGITFIDEIVTVCAVMVNICPSIIPLD